MVYITIMLFFVYAFCLGFTVTSFVKNSENFLERNLMRIGFGLAFLPFLGIALNLLRIPIDWRIILALSLAYPIYHILKHRSKPQLKFKISISTLSILAMLLLFVINLYIYASGAFAYPYLEDDDPWSHALAVKYVAVEKTVFAGDVKFHYLDPYPPTYDLLLGLLHQTNDSIYFTMKFFNALIISLSTIFFYFFVKELSQKRGIALFATFALVSIPSFMSHFIWSISLTMPLYFVVFYAMERIKHDNKWWIVAGLSMVTALASSPTHSTYFGLFFILYLAAKIILERKLLFSHIMAGALGLSLSFIFWWLPMILRHGIIGTISGTGFKIKTLKDEGIGAALRGTADRVYAFKDFFIAPTNNLINNPIGIGIVLSILAFIAILISYYYFFKITKKLNDKQRKLNSFFAILSLTIFISGMMVFSVEPLYTSFGAKFTIILITSSLSILLVLFFFNAKNLEEKDKSLLIIFLWLVFAFYSVNAFIFPIKLSPFRAWMLLAIPICILAAHAAINMANTAKNYMGDAGKYSILLLLMVGIYFTSAQQKIAVNTANWPPGGFWTSVDEIVAYAWMKDNLPKNSHAFTFSNNAPVIGMDMYTCHWCEDVRNYMKNGFNQSAQDTYVWLKKNNYEYIIIDGQTIKKFGLNETNAKIQQLVSSGIFKPEFQNNGALVFNYKNE